MLAPFAQGAKRALSDVQQRLDNLRRKDPLRGAETNEISVRLGNYSASHFEGPAVLPSLGQRLAATREEVTMMALEPVKMLAYAALAQVRIEAGVPKAVPHSSRLMQRPITRSCMVVVVVKPIVRRTRRVMRVRTCTGAIWSHAYRQAVLWHLDSCFATLPTLVSPSMPG